jgi:hypothetical protein
MPDADQISQQQTLLTMYRRTLAHYLKQQAAHGSAFLPPSVAQGIVEARDNIRRIKHILRDWQVPVEDFIDDEDDAMHTSPVKSQHSTSAPIDRVKLRQILTEQFDDNELREVYFDMSIDYESLGGSGKAAKARELIGFVERRGRYQELIDQILRLRPSAFNT